MYFVSIHLLIYKAAGSPNTQGFSGEEKWNIKQFVTKSNANLTTQRKGGEKKKKKKAEIVQEMFFR